jgi:glycosyltransferase involved in cell wall biosynthesis
MLAKGFAMTPNPDASPQAVPTPPLDVCFVGLENLPVLSRAYSRHGIGGEQVQQTLLARALAKRGHAVSMVVADYGQTDGEVIDGITLFKAHGLNEGLPVLRFFHPRITKLWAALDRAQAQVYYVSCASAQLGIVALYARLHQKRLVFRIASDTDCVPDQLLIRLWRDKRLYTLGLNLADVRLAQSEQQRRAMQANYGLPSRIAAMLVDPPLHERPYTERDIDVLWVNNLRPLKQPELYLELARRLPQLSFHLIGGPQAGSEDLYQRIATDAATIPNLHFHGQIPYHDVNDYYERARVFVNTSHTEGFPNSYLQAWRRGVPTITFLDPDQLIHRWGMGSHVKGIDSMAHEVLRHARTVTTWSGASARAHRYIDTHHREDAVLDTYIQAMRPPSFSAAELSSVTQD